MARTNFNEPQTKLSLEELIPLYGEKNTECKALEKEVSDYNSQIKGLLRDVPENSMTVAGWKATLSTSERETMNEDKLLDIAHANGLDTIIKTKEYIDYDVLEKEIYNGHIDQDVLLMIGSCKESKTVETLRISKVKEKM